MGERTFGHLGNGEAQPSDHFASELGFVLLSAARPAGRKGGQEQIPKGSTTRKDAVPAQPTETEAAPASSEKAEKIKAELNELLDEIDEVLEDNAEEFLRNYVQKGGE